MRPLTLPKQRLAYSVDLRQWMPPIDNQHDMKTWHRIYLFNCSCASAFAGLCNYLFKRSMDCQSSISRLFIYYSDQMIQQQLPVLIGIRLIQQNIQHNGSYLQVPTDLNDPLIKKTGIHGIMIVGYNKKHNILLVETLGDETGYYGYFYLPYDYLTHPYLIDNKGGLWSISIILK
ncbi:unnamed protein product [Adineta steineri]|uniref:Uncharacterized protein n=1 Tax=Adineta steineri TaxID=433720 RepID=A0A813ZQF7_9BILA|nr:unnamed protein product [Adineta steineri]CAF1210174.1 unnamed protein product [Adineta steineri]